MRILLAEQLIAKVMGWGVDDVSRERPMLQAMADYKYDSYQQFSPGMRFIESLALWLGQFDTDDERKVAYDFVKNRLLFCSQPEMNHMVSMTYRDIIKPILIRVCAEELGTPTYQVAKIVNSKHFAVLQRRCLFLGLSDGGKIDVFRHCNPELRHEQIFLTHELTQDRVETMVEALRQDISAITGATVLSEEGYFRMIFLLDDFAGSGLTNLRESAKAKDYEGKLAKFVYTVMGSTVHSGTDVSGKGTPLSCAIRRSDVHLGIILYSATQQALDHLLNQLARFAKDESFKFHCEAVQIVREADKVNELNDPKFSKLVDSYYDSSVHDKHMEVGGTKDVKRGFAACSLPLVLFHNTPNNSIFLLWSWSESTIGLFPRVTRHGGDA